MGGPQGTEWARRGNNVVMAQLSRMIEEAFDVGNIWESWETSTLWVDDLVLFCKSGFGQAVCDIKGSELCVCPCQGASMLPNADATE